MFVRCEKYLAAKPDNSLAIPQTLNDLELMLNNYDALNANYIAAGELATDNYYLTNSSWGSSRTDEQYYYIWKPYDDNGGDYYSAYRAIATVNLVLESLKGIKLNSKVDSVNANEIKGSALFFRGFVYWELAQVFCKNYNSKTAKTDLGLPLKTTSSTIGDFPRSTVDKTYQQIIGDLNLALYLLPDTTNYKYKASKAAAYGLLSRTYLSMCEYKLAGSYADSTLQLYNTLMDYNGSPYIDPASSTMPFSKWNSEIIIDLTSKSTKALARTRAIVDTALYAMYDKDDLRKMLFFQENSNRTGYYFKGNYTGASSAAMFYGITTDEMYLNRAECATRDNDLTQALSDINTLLQNRFEKDKFVPIFIDNKDSLLRFILRERRKELIFRGLRWTDLRRLNEEDAFKVILTREIDGEVYQLKPGDDRYTFLLPYVVIQLGGVEQNP